MSVLFTTGSNRYGQLGQGTAGGNKYKLERMKLVGQEGGHDSLRLVVLAENHSVQLYESGKVFTYGHGAHGRLGHGDQKDLYTPTLVASFESVKIVSVALGEEYTLFLDADGNVYSCGRGNHGQLGHDNKEDCLTPKKITLFTSDGTVVSPSPKILCITAGTAHSIFVDDKGGVWSCGSGYHGQLGHGSRENKNVPTKIPDRNLAKIVNASAGGDHTLLLTADGHVYAMGWNELGQCGFPEADDVLTPRALESLVSFKVSSFAAGDTHSVFVNGLGLAYTCGCGQFGRLGHGNELTQTTPTAITSLAKTKILFCAAGKDHTALIDQHERIHTFGWGQYGALGTGDVTHVTPTVVKPPLKGKEVVIGIFAGGHQTAVLAGSKEEQERAIEKLGVQQMVGKSSQGCVIS
eukprot:c17557_g1_i1.p1 GENE.c17557_g1_i1~~c17557_g1_i1.p1  ORF type:complete len:407 (-),score=185.04 c17557_g1_i1:140-1360(-)